jgi:hypothetical protein
MALSVEDFAATARAWLKERLRPRQPEDARWGEGSDNAAVFPALLGPRITADTGEWGTYAWTGQLLGAPGYRIAGGSDEVQRNIIAERVLGLPGEPRVDRDVPWRDVPR